MRSASADLEAFLTIDRDDLNRGLAGTPAVGRSWVAGESAGYGGGVRVWLDDESDRVVLVEGINPLGTVGSPFPAPELGTPDAVFDAVLGPVRSGTPNGCHADRGLALHVFPGLPPWSGGRLRADHRRGLPDAGCSRSASRLRKFPQGVVR